MIKKDKIKDNNKSNNYSKKVLRDKIKFNKLEKKFVIMFLIWIFIWCICLVKKSLQNDTLYTIKIGKLILDNGIDMLDHFSWHNNLPYTYPHWLYDIMIYLIYKIGGFVSIYISSILFMMLLIFIVFKTNKIICKNTIVAAFTTFICTLAIGGFATARAQLISFILFALEINFIESYLENGKKKYLLGLLGISLILCNVHVAVWPFYFILYLPCLVEFLVSKVVNKIKIKKENKFIKYIKSRFLVDDNKNIKMLFVVMILSLLTGFITPIGMTPYTYLIKTMMGNSQDYIIEHQAITWINSPFTIIIAGETLFLGLFSKIKLRDLFMICGLVLMSIVSIRHISLLALIGTICFSRVFELFLRDFNSDYNKKIISFLTKKWVAICIYFITILGCSFIFNYQINKDFLDKEFYPIDAVEYIKNNIDIEKMTIFNDYNYGSYLLFNDIPVFIDSRADLYTKQFSGLDYDIFDDYEYIAANYQSKFEFYNITHVLVYKNECPLYEKLVNDSNYKLLYEDEYYAFYEKLGTPDIIIDNNNANFQLEVK